MVKPRPFGRIPPAVFAFRLLKELPRPGNHMAGDAKVASPPTCWRTPGADGPMGRWADGPIGPSAHRPIGTGRRKGASHGGLSTEKKDFGFHIRRRRSFLDPPFARSGQKVVGAKRRRLLEGGAYLYAPPSNEQVRSAPVGIPPICPPIFEGGEGFLPPPLERFAPVTVRRPRTTFPSGIGGWATCLPKPSLCECNHQPWHPLKEPLLGGREGLTTILLRRIVSSGEWLRKGCPQWLSSLRKGVCPPGALPLGGNHYQSFDNMPFGHGETT
ncbi:hypothetical protein RRG08_015277 [Elysia crispata]|uniref:Uncharacterized protein n=1 Tax=Elysia crispata TaxID=231223 RepID=A0AAE1ATE9_9GAST|nr:hypothetical protein RRG08_015277 [Elysia crispata]